MVGKIDSYRFGQIEIDGRCYYDDVIIFPDRVQAGWWREEGHALRRADLWEVVRAQPEVLIVGTGAYGAMRIPSETERYLREKGIRLIARRTEEACRLYNQMCGTSRVVAALHLTC